MLSGPASWHPTANALHARGFMIPTTVVAYAWGTVCITDFVGGHERL